MKFIVMIIDPFRDWWFTAILSLVTCHANPLYLVNDTRKGIYIPCNMEEFHVESFVAEPTLQVLNTLMKHQLTEVANSYKLAITGSMKKGEIKRLLVDYLINEELVPEDKEHSPVTVDSNTLELKRLEFQERESAREAQLN